MASPRKGELPKIDLESPRIIAAMKVTGIHAAEINGLTFPEGDSASPRKEESQQRRQELMERKRRALLRELDDTAAALDESLVEAILSPSAIDAALQASARTMLEGEKQKIDERRERAKKEMQNELGRELARKKDYESTVKGREDWRKRVKEKHDEKLQQLANRAEQRGMTIQKQEECLNKNKKEDWKRRNDTIRKLSDDIDRVNKQAEERTQKWADTAEERRMKLASNFQKSVDIQRSDEEEKMRKAEERMQKQREREERLQKAAQEALHHKRSKAADKMDSVNDCLQDQQKSREKQFRENEERLEKARQHASDHMAETAERARTTREKEMEKWMTNRESQRKETRDKLSKLKTEISDGNTQRLDNRQKYLEETVYKQAEMKQGWLELVEQNKARISRADACTREQTLAKIRHTKDKINSIGEQRQQVSNYRTSALRDEMIGRTQLNELKLIVRDCSPKRINAFLKDLDLPLLPTEVVKEEGEDDKKQ